VGEVALAGGAGAGAGAGATSATPATATSAGPRVPQLLMRVLLLTAQRVPVLRSTVAEQLLSLTRALREGLVESPADISGEPLKS
jgi:hypothetical protein